MAHQRLYQLGAGLGRLAAKPFTQDGYTLLPPRLNPSQERRLPGLAPRSFREMWAAGELDET
jgi:hypothetical protein